MNTTYDPLLRRQDSSSRFQNRTSLISPPRVEFKFPLNPIAESFYQLSTLMNTHSCEWLQVQGVIDIDLCLNAIYHVRLRHPLTWARLIPPRGLKRAQWKTGEDPNFIPLWTHSLVSSSINHSANPKYTETQSGHFPSWLTQLIWDRPALDPTKEDPVEFHLVYEHHPQTHSVVKTHFLIIAPHLCTDARAGTQIMDEIAQIYGHFEQVSHLKNSLFSDQLYSSRPLDASFKPIPLESSNQILLPSLPPLPLLNEDLLRLPHHSFFDKCKYAFKGGIQCVKDLFQSAQGLDLPNQPRGSTGVYTHRVPPEELKAVLQAARKAKITAHVLFTWALTQVYKKRNQALNPTQSKSPLFRVADLFSLCPWLPQHAQNQFEVLVQPYTTTLDPQWTTEDAFYQINQRLLDYKQGQVLSEIPRVRLYTFFARLFPIASLKRQLLKRIFKTNITTTNPGRVPTQFESFGSLPCIDFINFPQIAPPARLGIIYTTFRNELRVVSLYDQSLFTQSEIQELTEDLWQTIKKLADEIQSK